MPFLDKFVFKNPKAAKRQERGGSIMQPSVEGVGGGRKGARAAETQAINSRGSVAEMLARPEAQVAAHERFFHSFFSKRKEAEEKALRNRPARVRSKASRSEAGDDDDGRPHDTGAEEEEDAEEEEFATRLAKSLLDDDYYSDDDDDGMGSGDGGSDDDDDDDDDDDGDDDDDDEQDGDDDDEGVGNGGMEGHDDEDSTGKRQKKKKRGGGPTFADAEAFAHILEAAGDDNDGLHPKLADWEEGKRKKRRK